MQTIPREEMRQNIRCERALELTSRFSVRSNFGMNNRCEMRHIQEKAKPGK